MFLLPSQGRRSQWPPSKAMSSSATTCPRLPFRAAWMRSRCPSAPCRGTACCFTRGSQLTMSTCPWGTGPCGSSSTWAPGPSRPWWSRLAGSLMTTSGMMFELPATAARCVCIRRLWLACSLPTWNVKCVDFIKRVIMNAVAGSLHKRVIILIKLGQGKNQSHVNKL